MTDNNQIAIKDFLEKNTVNGLRAVVHETADGFLFIQAVHPSFTDNDKSSYQRLIASKLATKFPGSHINRLFIFDSIEKAYTENGHLCTKSPTVSDGCLTTYLAENDAYILIREVDIAMLEYCSLTGYFDEDIECSGKALPEHDDSSFSMFKFSDEAKYLGIEVKGSFHKITGKVTPHAGGYFQFTVAPGMFPGIF